MNRLTYLIVFLLFSFVSCSEKQEVINHQEHQHQNMETYYTCSMHPQIKQDKPGKCPICHMTLTKVTVEKGKEDQLLESSKPVVKTVWQCKEYPDVTSEKQMKCPIDGSEMIKIEKKSQAEEVVAKVRLKESQVTHFRADLFPVTKMKMTKKVRLLGSVLQSEERQSKIPARVDGRVEKVYVRSTGAYIQKGDPVIDFYSPKLITSGEEYLLARRSYQKTKNSTDQELLKQSEERLKLWGIKQSQLEQWFKQKKIPRSITLYSQASGIVETRNAVRGKYFKEGQNFFELTDLSSIWVELDIYEQDAGLVRLGQEVELRFSALPGQVFFGQLDFVSPILNTKTRTLKVRTTISNPDGKLKPGMVADALLKLELEGRPLVIPRTAIIDTGKRKVVWIQTGEKDYLAKSVSTGFESEGYVEIIEGLSEDQNVVIEGNFLLDAQAQLFGGYEEIGPSGQLHKH